ncbi:MAG: hypothetical protein PF692_12185 [Kiritimatiellae bacterium]|jgi:hypothetical protein|nr:hypothetical protein [Kiritimatiellia bacterium]
MKRCKDFIRGRRWTLKKNQVIASLLRFFLKDSTEAAEQRFTAFHERNALSPNQIKTAKERQ